MKIPTKLIRCVWPPTLAVNCGDEKFDDLVVSIKTNGIREPLTIDLKWRVMDGNHRLAAAKILGIKTVDVRVWTETEFVE
jgi:ParB-like chromosome segregation protein Spo0J